MKHLVKKTAYLLLAVLMFAGSCLTTLTSAASVQNNAARYSADADAVFKSVEAAPPLSSCLVPKQSSLTSFEGFSNVGTVSFSIDLAPLGSDLKADVTLAYDLSNTQYLADVVLYLANRAPLSAQLYTDGSKLTVRCDELLGAGKVYGIKLDTPDAMLQKFSESALAGMLGITPDTVQEIQNSDWWQMLVCGSAASAFTNYLQAITTYVNAVETWEKNVLADAPKSVTAQSAEIDGVSYDVYTAQVVFDKEAMNPVIDAAGTYYLDALQAFTGFAGLSQDDIDEISSELQNALDHLSMECTSTFLLDRKSGSVIRMIVDFIGDCDYQDTPLSLQFSVTETGTDRYECTIMATDMQNDDVIAVTFGAKLNEKYKYLVWDGYLAFSVDGTEQVFNGTFSYDENKGSYTLDLSMDLPSHLMASHLTVAGTLHVAYNAFDVSVDKVSTCIKQNAPVSDGENAAMDSLIIAESVLPFPKLSFSYRAAAEISAPKNAIDLFALTEDDLYALIGRITVQAEKLSNDFQKALSPDTSAAKNKDSKVIKLYAVTYDDYEDYAHLYTREEFDQMVSEYIEYINTHSSY